MDLVSAFFSMTPSKATERLLTLSTQFGLYAARVGVQGISHIPTLFSDFVRRALHCDKKGNPDPIAFLIQYLDDIMSFSPESTMPVSAYKSLLQRLQKYFKPEDKKDPNYRELTDVELSSVCEHFLLNNHIFDKTKASRIQNQNFQIKIVPN